MEHRQVVDGGVSQLSFDRDTWTWLLASMDFHPRACTVFAQPLGAFSTSITWDESGQPVMFRKLPCRLPTPSAASDVKEPRCGS